MGTHVALHGAIASRVGDDRECGEVMDSHAGWLYLLLALMAAKCGSGQGCRAAFQLP
jgi:hypothetical protein